MRIIIIDNEQEAALRLYKYSREGFPNSTILPESNTEGFLTFNAWDVVFDYVRNIPDQQAILCLDLAIESPKGDYSDVLRGLAQGQVIRTLKPGWTLVAYTRFGDRARHTPDYEEAFDGIIEKGELDKCKTRQERIHYLQNCINVAINHRTIGTEQISLPSNLEIVDSLGMRTFRAAFGDEAIVEIIRNEAPDWTNITTATLSSGYSGAYMLSIRGSSSSGLQSLVLKVARDEQIIQDEIDAPTKYLSQLGPLSGHLASFDQEKKHLSVATGVYYRQAQISGSSLTETLKPNSWTHNRRVVRHIVKLCVDVCRHIKPSSCVSMAAGDIFKLSPVDIGRLETSAKFIRDFGKTLESKRRWPASRPGPQQVVSENIDWVRNWKTLDLTKVPLKLMVQHGDLNPGNIIIDKNGSLVLIDLQRLRPWPIGYDLARLALMLRLRTNDVQGHNDWLPGTLARWLKDPVADIHRTKGLEKHPCPEAHHCDQQFLGFLRKLPQEHREIIAYGYKLGSLWDLIKVVSYQDISPFKKIWAFLECWRLKEDLERQVKGMKPELRAT